jgi:glycosyltransferase involved in cell wall biosynthesis
MISLVLPAYNEAAGLQDVAEGLMLALDQAAISYELILVDNGSSDGTGGIIDSLVRQDVRVKKVHVLVNQGFGYGILCGLQATMGNLIGYMGSDGQVAPDDVAKVYELLRSQQDCDIAKVRRDIRGDGLLRKLQSRVFNALLRIFFGIRSQDVNGSPKIMRRTVLTRLNLQSKDWFIDAEVMIKASKLGLRVAEHSISFHARAEGKSNVNTVTIFEFLRNMVRYRWKEMKLWDESQ